MPDADEPRDQTAGLPAGDEPDPAAVVAAFGLGGPVTGWVSVGRAWSNRVYRLEAAGRRYAVKEMRNPWADPRWQDWLAESWPFEQRAIAAGVAAPVPVPVPATGGCVAWVPRRDPALEMAPVRAHVWADGEPAGPGPVTPAVARWAGQVLATLHGLAARPRDRDLYPRPNTATAGRWPELTAAASRTGAAWAGLLDRAAPAVRQVAELSRAARLRPEPEVLSHGDIDQKNMIATVRGPVLCDWDLVTPVVPRRELADVALSMGGWRDAAIARQVVLAYRQSGGDDSPFEPADLGPALTTGLDWIALNIERATGLRPANDAEADLSLQLVPDLVQAIAGEVATASRISDLLEP